MLHSHTDYTPGRKGATRAAYDPENPMLLVRKLWIENKTADLEEIQRLVRRALGVSKDPAVAAFVDYATANLVKMGSLPPKLARLTGKAQLKTARALASGQLAAATPTEARR